MSKLNKIEIGAILLHGALSIILFVNHLTVIFPNKDSIIPTSSLVIMSVIYSLSLPSLVSFCLFLISYISHRTKISLISSIITGALAILGLVFWILN